MYLSMTLVWPMSGSPQHPSPWCIAFMRAPDCWWKKQSKSSKIGCLPHYLQPFTTSLKAVFSSRFQLSTVQTVPPLYMARDGHHQSPRGIFLAFNKYAKLFTLGHPGWMDGMCVCLVNVHVFVNPPNCWVPKTSPLTFFFFCGFARNHELDLVLVRWRARDPYHLPLPKRDRGTT